MTRLPRRRRTTGCCPPLEPPGQSDLPGDLPLDPDANLGPAGRSGRTEGHRRIDMFAVVAAGGAIGSLGRYGITSAAPVVAGRFPTSTLMVNLSGSFVLGALLVILTERRAPSRYARAFLAVGVIGAFTTFSSFAVQIIQLAQDHHLATSAAFLAASVVGGLAAAKIGVLTARAAPGRPPLGAARPPDDPA